MVTCPLSVIFTATDIFRTSLLTRYSLFFYFAHIIGQVKDNDKNNDEENPLTKEKQLGPDGVGAASKDSARARYFDLYDLACTAKILKESRGDEPSHKFPGGKGYDSLFLLTL
jgi:hypothetical protein